MANVSYICIVWISICVDLLSAEPEISVSGPVGSTAVLPCQLTSVDTDRLYIRWNIESEIVFERLGERLYQGEEYEGRVDVPVEELRKGNCSLVWSNLRLTDEGIYTSYQASLHTSPKELLTNRVGLSVYSEESHRGESSAPSGDAVMKSPHPLVLSLVSCLLVQLFCGKT
ncbi:CD276 antigen homolog isoform 1-T2 [Clarias gariepinus]|uniref:CD276 antigen homolog n=1 Tax=Clarias gariepinus TaxID=13013 RepID=UPI00234D2906|nr:CD276 antigen homolog [Clarias gariepinus]